MNSGPNTPQSQDSPITTRTLPLNAGAMPSGNHVSSVLKNNTGGSPLDYIRNNLMTTKPEPVPQVVQQAVQGGSPEPTNGAHAPSSVASAPPVKPLVQVTSEEALPDAKALAEKMLNKAADPETPLAPEPIVDPQPEDLDIAAVEKGSINENFKKLKTKYLENKKAAETREQELTETKTKLAKYESGEVLPDALKEQSSRIQELEKYEKIYNLEKSPEYNSKFIKPLDEIKGKLETFAKAYNIPPEELAQLIDIEDIADANSYLSERFDDLSALQVRQLVDTAQGIKQQMAEAKREPESVLTQLLEEGKVVEQHRIAATNTKIASKVKSSWSGSLHKIKQEGWATELIYRDNDTEHNKKYVEPIIHKAAEEHGKIISALVQAGMREIPDELSDALARQTLLAHAAATAIASRDYITKAYAELEANTKKSNSYRRPSVGSSFNGHTGGGAPAIQNKPMTPESMAVQLREQVQGKK